MSSPFLRSVLIAMALPSLAWAQTFEPAAPTPPTPSGVDTIEIIAHLPGPALWRVTTDTSQLWLLGLAGPVPKRMEWDTRRAEAALDGARELVVPPGASVSVIDIAGLLLDPAHRYHMPGGKTLSGTLPEPLRSRYVEAVNDIGQNPAHYDHWRPGIAAIALMGDAQRYDQLNPQGPQETVMNLAKAGKIPVRRLTNYRLGELLTIFNNAAPDAPNLCLSAAVEVLPHLPTFAQNIADAWKVGHVAEERAAERQLGEEACFDATPGIGQLKDKVAQDWAKDLAGALAKPGKTVVAVDMDSLTRKGGLLDQLRAEGLDVVGPAY